MNILKKLTRTIPAILLALALVNATSCDIGGIGYEPETPGTGPGAPQGNNDDNGQGNQQGSPKNHYSEYANFNTADYPIINESGKPDSEVAEAKDIIWLMYAEREDAGDWTTNYIKTNKIKTILGPDEHGWGWVETQSKYMVLATDTLAIKYDLQADYADARAKDPSLPEHISVGGSSWFLGTYAENAFIWSYGSAMTLPLREASKEDMLKVARALLACRDPKQAGVTDEALWTA